MAYKAKLKIMTGISLNTLTKAEQIRVDSEVKIYVCSTVVDYLNEKFKRSIFRPKGGFRQGWGYSFKVYGLMDIITVNARYYGMNGDNQAVGRMMINSLDFSEKRSNKIIKLLDMQIINDVHLSFEIDCANGHSLWLAWKIQ